MLEVSNLDFSYGDRQILHDISFKAEGNSVVSILGPNGVGKTTLLKCVCNFQKPQHGNIVIDKREVSEFSAKECAKYIGYVPQKASVTRSTVFDSILIGRRPYIDWNATKNDLEITWGAIETLGLSELALKYVDEISGGEFQKVQIARAIVQEPKVLILDEPTNNLDIKNQHITMHTVIDAVREKGVCTVMTMHDINLAVHYSDKLLFMKDGRKIAFGGTDIITKELIQEVYGIKADVIEHKGIPFVIPYSYEPGLPHYHHVDDKYPHDAADHLHEAIEESEHVH